ncbi:hypothetical protein [Brevibacillus brevis]|nr:hypothetical protein [Brevibacillus brevis]PSJ67512.1 hypothetical protein C7J99_19675 [Brevibacillus brevis]RED32813.1 hypothetical protein DES34_103125 [Brevibacillus brevis]GEC92835.1 hypothetical protein BBR01nite_51660 [Brevibacillus brevis]VEF90486.1 Uncharacterised protein [Brevibacillus brevis]
MSEQPFWFKATVTIVVVIGILALLTSVAFFQLLAIVGLVVISASKGVLEWKKNRDWAVIIFALLAFQIVIFIKSLYDFFT